VVFTNAIDNINFKILNIVEKKTYVININTNFNKLIKYFSANYFVDFVIVDDKLNIIANINQKDVLEHISKGKYFYK
jgi:predicted transcriptional regulator